MPVKFIRALLITLLASCLVARAQVSEDLYYQEYNASVTITGCSQLATGPITIPATINGKPVTELRNYAFSMCNRLTSVDIQAPITTIGPQTFYSCSKLQNIKLPSTLTSIGSEAFYSCWSLTSVTLPDKLTSIGSEAFFYCEKLANVTFPGKVSFIGSRAFAYCALRSLVLPASLKTMGDQAFLTCQDLKKATFLGNAPGPGNGYFNEAAPGFTIYFHEGKSGFSTPEWRGFPCRRLSPEITILQPEKTSLVDGVSNRDFGRVKTGKTSGTKTFTIRNTGKLPLTGIKVSLTGEHVGHFTLTAPKQTIIEPGADAKFKIIFKPRAAGKRKAVVRIKSNDRSEPSFEIGLTGTGG